MRISSFRKNTKHSAVKQLAGVYSGRLYVAGGVHTLGTVYATTFRVPAGAYLENVLIKVSFCDKYFPSNTATLSYDSNRVDETRFLIQVFQVNNSTYRIEAVALGEFAGFRTDSFFVDVKLKLAKSVY